ncbi:type VII secretion protein EccB [Mycolicibacillus koreensis]|nr:type VII secretion protein EccB [Mycolicibacillus koreensis]ODR04635.1 type VII secretion protein EccB [Mycolicibacillus koreensis]
MAADQERRRPEHGAGLGLSTRTQMTGHQFLARRTALALTQWRVRMEVEPGRRQSLAVLASISAACLVCIGALLWSFLSPAGQLGDSPIIADRDSGALYVRVGDTLYPALNLASARLISGRADNPHKVRSSQIAEQPHGPLVGIPGAPSEFSPVSPDTSSWLICDAVTTTLGTGVTEPVTTTVIDGTPDLSERRRVLDDQDAVVLRYEDDAWVIRQGRRSRIDAADRPVLLPLGLTPEQVARARPMSQALYDALPPGPELSVPQVPNVGQPAAFPNAPGPVGTVIVTPQVSGPQQYSVVLTDGVQTISSVVAQILQNAGITPGGKPATVQPPDLGMMPVVGGLDLSAYPTSPLNVVDTRANPATCWWWERGDGEELARIQVISGPTVPVADTHKVVSLVKADASEADPMADRVYFGPSYANFIVVTGNDPAAATTESLWWLSRSGVRYGVESNDEVRKALGLTSAPTRAPWVALRLFARGPALSRADALVQHDKLPTDMNPGELRVPR